MVKRLLFLFLLIVSVRAFSQLEDDNRIQNQFIVMLKPDRSVESLVKQLPELDISKCLSKQMNIWLLDRNNTTTPDKFLEQLQVNKLVKLAQFNHRVQRRSLVPNDPYFNSQWNMMNTGQGGGLVGADIDATDAWAINHNNVTANGDSVVVAIIDGDQTQGFDITHEDLNFFVNYHEIPGNGIDDDSDGFVDDYLGWNSFSSTGDIQPGGSSDTHAMRLSGIAAAIGNNGKGVAGVCWGAKVMRVVGASSLESQVVEAYDYVREMRRLYNNTNGAKGAFVVSTNTSFGIDKVPYTDYPIWCAMYDSMGYVGILSAAATANGPWDVDLYGDMPTACPSKFLITVTNTTSRDQLNPSAAWGDTTIALGAPGSGIYSTDPGNTYGFDNGTSFSAPHVTGTVAAMFAAACPKLLSDYKLYPDSVALVVKRMILSGVTRLSELYNITITGGRLNLYNAIKNLDVYNCSACNYTASLTTTQPDCSNTCNGSLQANVIGTGHYAYSWSNSATGSSVISNLCPGTYSVTITDTLTGCSQVQNAYLYKPDSIVVSHINTIPVVGSDSGNIIVSAGAGNYPLQYSLDGVHYQQASTLIVSSNGTYTVYIRNSIGCVVQRSVIVSDVQNITQHMDWNLFPNPAFNQLNISLNLPASANLTFVIADVLGQKISTGKQTFPGGLHTITKDVSNLQPGTYFLTISDGNSNSTQRFVVAR